MNKVIPASQPIFGDLLKYLRTRQQMTQQKLGLLLGYSAPHVARLESGERLPDMALVKTRFIEVLGLQHEPDLANRLVALAAASHGEVPVPALESPAVDEALHPATSQLTNLPQRFNSFVGRQTDIARIRQLLTQTRLLTLIGSGGSGKTRLATEVGSSYLSVTEQNVAGFDAGVWLTELAPLSDPGLVADSIVRTLGLQQKNDQPLDALTAYLQHRRALLILDNCEHVIEVCAQLVATLLQVCPNLNILTTSRERLNIPAEVAFRVLSLPAGDAAQLFIDRAMSANAVFCADDDSMKSIARICDQVDGIPLAIELAAAQSKGMTVQGIVQRLNKRLELLNSGARTAVHRHQTLRSLIDWSYGLLTEPERALFRRLAVFQGGCTLEAAEAMCSGWMWIAATKVTASPLDVMLALVSKCLVELDNPGAETRYHLLETIREYAWEKLTLHGEVEHAKRKHAECCLSQAIEAEECFFVPGREKIQALLKREQNNTRAALEWCFGPGGDPEIGLRLAGALWKYWLQGGYSDIYDGHHWLEAALSMTGPATPAALRIPAVLGAGLLQIELNPSDPLSIQYCGEALAYGRSSGNMDISVFALEGLIRAALYGGGTADPGDLFAQALNLAAQTRYPSWFRAMLYNGMANYFVLVKRDFNRASAAGEESLALWRNAGDMQGVLSALIHLAQVSLYRIDFPQAVHYAEEGLSVLHRHGDFVQELMLLWCLGEAWRSMGVRDQAWEVAQQFHARALQYGETIYAANALELLGKIARDQGDYETARGYFEQSIHIYASASEPWRFVSRFPYMTSNIACLAVLQGHTRRAARLWGMAASALRVSIHAWLVSHTRFEYAPYICATRQGLSSYEYQAAFAEGEATPPDRMLALLLAAIPEGDDPQWPLRDMAL